MVILTVVPVQADTNYTDQTRSQSDVAKTVSSGALGGCTTSSTWPSEVERMANILLVILAVSVTAYCNIVRLPCKYEADFDTIIEQHRASLPPLKQFTAKTRKLCLLECLSFNSCQSINYQALSESCQILSVNLSQVGGNLTSENGWVFIAASNQAGNKCRMLDPCQNNGVCEESCDSAGYKCTCDEFHYGQNCQDDLISMLDYYCSATQSPTVPFARFDGHKNGFNSYDWRCYAGTSLTGDLVYFNRVASLYWTRSVIGTTFSQYHKTSEYTIGSPGASCNDACIAIGKTCNPRIRTGNSVYAFHLLGIRCKNPNGIPGKHGAYHHYDVEPSYYTTGNYCHGFVRLPSHVSCTAHSATERRLCRCA